MRVGWSQKLGGHDGGNMNRSLRSMAMAFPNGLSVQATPTRSADRHPFPASAQPSPAPSLRQTANSSASASFTHLPTASTSAPVVQVSQQTITVDSLLRQHASSPDPTKAALEQVVTDRNVLSSQNTQLWKLIEKQRTGYNQILKELERIRGERDSYKAKLAALNGVPNGVSDKRQKTLVNAVQGPAWTHSPASPPPINPPLKIEAQPLATTLMTLVGTITNDLAFRSHFISTATPRSSHHPQPPQASRSYDPMAFRANDFSYQPNGNQPSILASARSSSPHPGQPLPAPVTPSTRQSSRPSPSPLVVPTRIDTLSAYTISDSPDSSTSCKPPSGEPNNATNNLGGNGIYAPPAPRPLPHPRKSSLADSVSSVVTSGSSVISSGSAMHSGSSSISSHNFGGNQSTPSQQYHPGLTPATAPANFNNPFNSSSESLLARQRGLSPAGSSPPVINSSPAPSPSPLANGAAAPSQLPHPQMLGVDPRPHFVSRDSRISLPDEASRYIQNMTESPVASPRAETFTTRSKLSNAVYPPPSSGSKGNGRESEFLDMEEEEDEEEDSEQDATADNPGDITLGASDPSSHRTRTPPRTTIRTQTI